MEYVTQELTDFVSTNLTDVYPVWDDTVTYVLETDDTNLTSASVVRYGTYYYRSLTNNNLNYNPVEYENIKWIKLGTSNKYAMLDLKANTKSRYDNGNLQVYFQQNGMRTLGIGNFTASEVEITIYDADETTILWQGNTGNTINEDVEDYFTYMYSSYNVEVDRAVKVDLPLVGSFVKVELIKSTELDYTDCGFLIGGQSVNMGETLFDIKFSFNSFATKEFDDSGNLSIVKRGVQDIVDFETVIPSSETPSFKREIKKIYNDIVMFVVDESTDSVYENLITLGTIQNASILMSNHVESILSYSIIEVI